MGGLTSSLVLGLIKTWIKDIILAPEDWARRFLNSMASRRTEKSPTANKLRLTKTYRFEKWPDAFLKGQTNINSYIARIQIALLKIKKDIIQNRDNWSLFSIAIRLHDKRYSKLSVETTSLPGSITPALKDRVIILITLAKSGWSK